MSSISRKWMGVGLLAAGAAACGAERESQAAQAQRPAGAASTATAAAPPAPPPQHPTAADSAALKARIAAQHDSVEAAFTRARPLGASEVSRLRQDVNAEQVATARRLGIPPSTDAEIRRLLAAGRLVQLADSTDLWVLRDMDHSVPYVTPNARGMLMELGRRFQARLNRLGLPRYRMKVTSALRTDETQAQLRKINSYATRTVSAHEFGTTVDVSHERFAVPADRSPAPEAELRAEMLEDAGKAHAKVLQAELGRALAEMRDAGDLHVMMENMQPVYHMTVARPFPQ